MEDDLREQVEALRARAEDAERRAAVAEAIAAERARSLDDMRLTLRALTAAPAHVPAPPVDDGQDAAAWAEHPDRSIRADATIHRGQDARDATATLLAEVLADAPQTAAEAAAARAAARAAEQPTHPTAAQSWWRRFLHRRDAR